MSKIRPYFRFIRIGFLRILFLKEILRIKACEVLDLYGRAPVADCAAVVTSFPARIHSAHWALRSLRLQSVRASRLILVLAEGQFPGRKLPESLAGIEGLEILWTQQDWRSYKKLATMMGGHEGLSVITFDDDIVYGSDVIASIIESVQEHPDSVVGRRGVSITRQGAGLASYESWQLIRSGASTKNGDILLTGAGGIYYPSSFIRQLSSCDWDRAMALCPSADDLWMWAQAIRCGVPTVCLGRPGLFEIPALRDGPHLKAVNKTGGMNDKQMSSLMSEFAEIKNSLGVGQ